MYQANFAGFTIWDVTDPAKPELLKNVQACKGSHTHTVIPSPTDKNVIYIYVSGQQAARAAALNALAKQVDGDPSGAALVRRL